MANSIISIKNLFFSYGNNRILKNINVDIKEGAITTIIGANGCGKSTLFNLLSKNLMQDAGTIEYSGENVANISLKDFAKKVAIVHQYNSAPSDITVESLVSYGRAPYKKFGMSSNPTEDEDKIRLAMEITGIYEYRDRLVSDLSGGQKQRVWIAMAIAQDTKVLLLDEPTTYLDVKYQLQILKLVKRLNVDYGITVVMILHDINQALYYSDEIIALSDGCVRGVGSPKEIITGELIRDVFDVELDINMYDGKPFVLPVQGSGL